MERVSDKKPGRDGRAIYFVVHVLLTMLDRLPIARWGWKDLNLFGWPLIAFFLLCLFLPGPWRWLGVLPAVVFVWLVSFFRDPFRLIPADPRALVAPADGKVVDITPLDQYDFIGRPAVRIGIFLSIFNVHINRAPCAGRVLELHYHPGEFLNAMRPESAVRNEFMWIGLEHTAEPTVRFAVRQISGMLARRIVCDLQPGQAVSRGEKFGMIKLGSRTELILPADSVELRVKVGDTLRAGADIVATWRT
ncbi:MAG: phosphatidylserine decarboxylase family protein [Pirellulales bacterium]|nr:phosphatidylserine decarboxylase family protein [Pirellulales bacterium]